MLVLVVLLCFSEPLSRRVTKVKNYAESDEDSHLTTYKKKLKRLDEKGVLSEYRQMENLRQKINYRMQTPTQRKRQNEMARLRMERKRERDSAKKRLRSSHKAETRTEEELAAKRKYWRDKQKERRDRIKGVKGQDENDSDSSLLAMPSPQHRKPTLTPNKSQLQKNPSDRRTLTPITDSRYKAHLPKSPTKWTGTVLSLIEKATPRKKAMLDKSLPLDPDKIKANSTIVELRLSQEALCRKRTDKARKRRLFSINTARKHIKNKTVKNALGLKWSKLLSRAVQLEDEIKRKAKSDGLTE